MTYSHLKTVFLTRPSPPPRSESRGPKRHSFLLAKAAGIKHTSVKLRRGAQIKLAFPSLCVGYSLLQLLPTLLVRSLSRPRLSLLGKSWPEFVPLCLATSVECASGAETPLDRW